MAIFGRAFPIRPWISKAPQQASSGINASLSITEANDTLAATATVLVSPSLAVTEANDTIAATATVSVSAALAATEANDSLSASVAILVQASLAISEAADTLTATCNTLGVSAINAILFATEDDDRILASIHRNSYIPNPTERGHYISRHAPKPWLGGLGEGPTK